ncbi:hypothetical protein GYMLUDRAFT_169675 [Collybiopsis luxurians FD-317 M1]|uniref:Uncharacterized protein n=1 Tax=Collybiopsis luxurians FD-317 M1 TaxID=944289 RepID=A0A0D0C9V8_9AGAR|nr:hypothetical protein GYMLUDRAFT_169675 [Collybiopsis luxurians FD-317 M1]
MALESYEAVAAAWMAQFSECLRRRDANGTALLFHPDGWLRDFLVFQWDLRTLHGQDKILTYLSSSIHESLLSNFQLASDDYFRPSPGPAPDTVTAGFTFATPIANGRGFINLMQTGSPGGEWKASTVFMSLDSLKGFEEPDAEGDIYQRFPTWSETRALKWQAVEKEPEVLIIGAGQNGLQVAARFRQMQIPTLVIERNERVGDVWRGRYPSLMLHTPKPHHSFLYQPFPDNWPIWTPGNKLAEWLEQYAISQDLLVWTRSRIVPPPTYSRETKRWTVNIDKAGESVILHPKHIVVATGTLGEPYVPKFEGKDLFQGQILHSSSFRGGSHFTGKRCVVIGTGNSGADIALDLSIHGAQSVTIIQRSSTCVQPADMIAKQLLGAYPINVPVEVSDFRAFATPTRRILEIFSQQRKISETWEKEKEFITQLQDAGMQVDLGPDDTGVLGLVYLRFGGMDVGCGERIISRKIQVKSGVQIEKLGESSLTFDDGSIVEADAIIFATGYQGMKKNLEKLLGDTVINQTKSLPYGIIDEEGELPAGYRPTGHPGVSISPQIFANVNRIVLMDIYCSSGSPRVPSTILGYSQSIWSVVFCSQPRTQLTLIQGIQIQALNLGYMTA